METGVRLGPYEIIAPLGAGGMGQVYRARDTRLGRDVAIKVLNPQVSANADLKARFEREARAISALQHPHICVLHDIGHDDASGSDFLVMEYLEGETLADRNKRGPLPLDHALKIGIQVADALDKAHRAGILHRDLKPSNIMLTSGGAKLLDFGLAKSAGMASASSGAPLLSAALTLSGPSPHVSPLTTAGTIVGTVQYMSPEQLQGMEADSRSDIFALGGVLYEMFSGKRPFDGKSQISLASAILEKDPDPLTTAQPAIPSDLERIVSTCLAKNPADRVGCAQDVKLALQWVAAATQRKPVAGEASRARRRRLLATAAAAMAVAAIAALGGFLLAPRQPAYLLRAVISTPDKVTLDATGDFAGPVMISPDGQTVAFVAHGQDGPRALWVRPLHDNNARRLDNTDEASFPFWSADSRYIAFFARGKLNKIPAAGGPVLAIADGPNPRGGSWGANDVIVYAPDFQSALSQVGAQGGAPTPVTKVDGSKHTTHRWPAFLPDGRHFLYLATNHNGGVPEQNGVYLGSIDGGESRMILASDSGAAYANGYLLFHAQNALLAQPFDPSSGTLGGEPSVVVDRIAHDPGTYRTIFAAANNGTLVYQGGAGTLGTDLVWVDRTGRQTGRAAARAAYSMAVLSPDGKRIVAPIGDPKQDLFVIDPLRGTSTRLTFEPGPTTTPSWSPDGRRIFYSVFRGGSLPSNISVANNTQSADIYVKAADGAGPSRLVLEEEMATAVRPAAMSPQLLPDGKTLLYLRRAGPSGHSIYSLSLAAGAKPVLVIAPATNSASIVDFRVSRDGRWIAYSSNESGRSEVFVVPYPNPSGAKWQITSDGGQAPAWRGDGKELFLAGLDALTIEAVSFNGPGAEPQFGGTQRLFVVTNNNFAGTFDVTPDGQHFLLNVVPDQTSTPINLVVNWPEALKKK